MNEALYLLMESEEAVRVDGWMASVPSVVGFRQLKHFCVEYVCEMCVIFFTTKPDHNLS